MASSSTAGAVGGATYQVFLSFRGPDTRQGFTDVLYHALLDAGIRVFRDNEEIRKGEEIGGEIMRAIHESRIFVPIFSRGYASSKWCLLELTEMVESTKGSSGKKILPVFYDVGVDDVKLKTELYSEALREHSEKFGPDKVQLWEEALRIAGKIKGWELRDTGYGVFARLVVREVTMKLKVKHKLVTDFFVQRDELLDALMKLLDIESSDVRFIGVHGTSGMGKTTLAKVVFNKVCDRFDCCSFLADVRESNRQHKDIERLQERLLCNLGLKSGEVMDVDDGIKTIRERLSRKKVLIVLDDVDEKKQIDNLAGDASWFGLGSRIIITTRNQRVLTINQQRIQTLEVEKMKHEEAHRLFCMHAFEKDCPPHDYRVLSEEAVASTGQLPLALEVIGSDLRHKSFSEWIDTIDKWKKVPHQDVQKKLMISYKALTKRTQQIFLDIACFFINSEKTLPMYFWKACDFDPEMGLRELIDLSLVKIIVKEGTDPDGIKKKMLWMHDQLRDIGRKVVYDESLEKGINRSRLWLPEDALKMLLEKEDKENVEMLCLGYDESAEGYTFTQEELSSLRKLRYLQCTGANFLSGKLKHVLPYKLRGLSWHKCPPLLPKLRWLSWHNCPPKFTRTDLCLRNLVILDLSGSDISEDWGGWIQIGERSTLKVLDLSDCKNLRRTPDLSAYSSLERLILRGCSNLVEVDLSIGKLEGLKYLDASYCGSLNGFPEELCSLYNLEVVLRHDSGSFRHSKQRSKLPKLAEMNGDPTSLLIFQVHNMQIIKLSQSIGRLERLRHLSLCGCSGLEILPDTLGDMNSLLELDLRGTDVASLPQTIGRLEKLELLSLHGCEMMKKLPVTIGNLKSLVKMAISASGIIELPDTIGNLEKLRVLQMCKSKIKELPTSIGMLKKLEELDASYTQIAEIPSMIEGLTCLSVLNLERTCVSLMPPKLPTGLTELRISSPLLEGFPEVSNLHKLVRLFLEDCKSEELRLPSFCYSLTYHTPRPVAWDLRLRKIASIPKELSSLSQVQWLTLQCPNLQYCPPLPSSLLKLELVEFGEKTKLPRLSNLKNLLTLVFRHCCVRDDTIGDLGVGELELLRHLYLFSCEFRNLNGFHLPGNLSHLCIKHCKFLEALPGLSHLKNLKVLSIDEAEKLAEIPDLEEFESLQELTIERCNSLERLPSLSKLKSLRTVRILSCRKFKGMDDIGELKSLEILLIKKCYCKDIDIHLVPSVWIKVSELMRKAFSNDWMQCIDS